MQRAVGKQDFLELFGHAFLLAFDSASIQSAFQATSVHPFNLNAISPDQMKPSEVASTMALFPIPLASPVRRVMAVVYQHPPTNFDIDKSMHQLASDL